MARNLAYSLLSGVGAAGAWRRLRPPRAVVFMCHSVGEPTGRRFDPNARWRISKKQLVTAIACAQDQGFEAVSMGELADRVASAAPARPAFALTFDDGYADNLSTALQVCTQYGVPMTTYVTSGFVRRTHTAWWHLFEKLIADESQIDIELDDVPTTLRCGTLTQKQQAFDRIAAALTSADPGSVAEVVATVGKRYGGAAANDARDLFLNESQLREFSAAPLVEVGVHGVSHGALASMAQEEVSAELGECADYLDSVTGTRPRHMAYPFGSKATVGPREVELARSLNYQTAVTTRHGCVASGDDALALPRIGLFPTDTVSSLRCKLSGLTTAFARVRRR